MGVIVEKQCGGRPNSQSRLLEVTVANLKIHRTLNGAQNLVRSILDAHQLSTILETTGPDSNPQSFGVRIIRNRIFGGKPEDRDHAIAVYQKNTSDVQAVFSSDRLLTYQLGDGWEPLCRFMGEPIPEIPFPKNNSTEQFRAHILKK